MCLDSLGHDLKPCKKGYKAMEGNWDRLYSAVRGNGEPRPMGVWLDEEKYRGGDRRCQEGIPIFTGNEDCIEVYPKGWHVYHTKRAAQKAAGQIHLGVVVRVECQEPVAVGYQSYPDRVTVCKRIKITEVL